jgi:hypothetical protein
MYMNATGRTKSIEWMYVLVWINFNWLLLLLLFLLFDIVIHYLLKFVATLGATAGYILRDKYPLLTQETKTWHYASRSCCLSFVYFVWYSSVNVAMDWKPIRKKRRKPLTAMIPSPMEMNCVTAILLAPHLLVSSVINVILINIHRSSASSSIIETHVMIHCSLS